MADKSISMSNCDINNFHNYTTANKEKPIKNVTLNWLSATSSFSGRSEILTNIHQYLKTNKIVVIYGAPGIGKTETARFFAKQNSDYFAGNLIWIYTETPEKIRKCFEDLAKSLDLKITDVSQVYGKFGTSRCLFVFDNVENMANIRDYLPSSQVHQTVKVLITSQFSQWDSSIGKVPLKALNLEDALEIFRDKFEGKFNEYPIEIWKDLAEHLEGIPLSIQIVSALIKQEFSKVRIGEFILDNFVSGLAENFINLKFPETEIMYYNKTVLASIYSALNRLEKEDIRHSLEVLCFLAYLDADRICHENLLFVPTIHKSKEILEEALNILTNYSLIQIENNNMDNLKIKVHRTILLVLRKYDLNKQNGSMFKAVIKTILLYFYKFNHVNTVFKYIKRREFKDVSVQVFHEIENTTQSITYLIYLARFHCHEILQEILPTFKDKYSKTIYTETLNKMLYDAICNQNNNLFTIKLLIQYGAKIEFTSEANGFLLASSWLSVDLFDHLLKSNDSENIINSQDRIGRTILHILGQSFNGNNIDKTFECMDHLISKLSADISIQDDELENILHTVCQNAFLSFRFLKLISEKCNCKNLVNTKNKWNETPLQVLVQYNYSNTDLLKIFTYFMKECKADISIRDVFKKNTLFYVCRYGTANIIEFVLKTGRCRGIINNQDEYGDVAFTELIYNKRIEEQSKINLIQLFTENGIDFKIKGHGNKTIVEISEELNLIKLAETVKKYEKY